MLPKPFTKIKLKYRTADVLSDQIKILDSLCVHAIEVVKTERKLTEGKMNLHWAPSESGFYFFFFGPVAFVNIQMLN